MNKDKIKAENIKILEKYSLAFEIKNIKFMPNLIILFYLEIFMTNLWAQQVIFRR